MAASSRGLLGFGKGSQALALALSLATFGPVGCDEEKSGGGAGPPECDAVSAPCARTQVCEGGTCQPAARCPDGTCADADADGDPLFCEFEFCVEACQPGALHCAPPDYTCDQRSHTCKLVGACLADEDCLPGQICRKQEGEDEGACGVGIRCIGDGECETAPEGQRCHPTSKFCVACVTNEHCEDPVRPVCNPETFACDREPPTFCLDDIQCCPPGVECEQKCDVTQDPARCVEGLNCFENYDCLEQRGRYCFQPGGTTDEAGECRTKCDQGGSCPRDFECMPNGECGQRQCQGDEDCDEAAGQRCIAFIEGGPKVCGVSECGDLLPPCPNAANGGTCEELAPGFGRCKDGVCRSQGQPNVCVEVPGWICDLDPVGGQAFIHCQEPCQNRDPSRVCPLEHFCDVAGGSGLCVGITTDIGCMTSESCDELDECCNRSDELPIPLCGSGACGPEPCRSDASCSEGEICVDDGCVDASDRPVVCGAGDACPGRQVCGLAGGCELIAPCAANADCPGQLTCDAGSGRCSECASDGDCRVNGNGVVCGDSPSGRYRKCLEPAGGFCENDGQCVGDRRCVAGFCEPDPEVECVDDSMDRAYASTAARDARPPRPGNHSSVFAAPVGAQTYTGLVLCDGKDDWFRIALQQGQDVEVTLVYDVNGGTGADLSLALREGNTVFGKSDSIGGIERVGINGAPFDGEYLVHVTGTPGASGTPYQLTFRVGDICVDDAIEGPAGNDQADNATRIEPGLVPDLILCDGDSGGSTVDIYALDLAAGTNATVIATWDENDGRINGTLIKAAGGQILDAAANVTKQTFGDHIRWDVANWEGGRLNVRLQADAGNAAEIRYDIRVLAECSDVQKGGICDDAPGLPLRPGPLNPATNRPEFYEVEISGNTCAEVGLTNCWSGSCDPLAEEHVAREKVWKLDTTAAPFTGNFPVEITTRYRADDPDFQGVVTFRSDCLDDSAETSCRLNPRGVYDVTVRPAVHYFTVDGRGEDCGPFEVTMTVRERDDLILNPCDSCGDGCALGDPENDLPGIQRASWARTQADPPVYAARLVHTNANAQPEAREGGIASCMNQVNNARFGPDTVFRFSTPPEMRDGCQLTARLDAPNFVGGIALRTDCPGAGEIACKFENNFVAKVLFVEQLDPGTYTLWVKGAGALQAGDFTVDLQCNQPGGVPPGDTCDNALEVPLEPLTDRRGFVLGTQIQNHFAANVGAADDGDYGAACRRQPCDPADADDCGGDIFHHFAQVHESNLWLAELDADYPATMALMRGGCDGLEEVACGNNAQPIELDDLPAGDYYLVVDAEGAAARGGHEIQITSIEGGVGQPPNDACAGEYPNPAIREQEIGFAVGRRIQVDGATFGGNDDRGPVNCGDSDAGAADVVYVYTADEEHELEVRVFANFRHNLYIRRADCEAGPEVACAVGDLDVPLLAAGTYYLFVDGVRNLDQGGFTLQVTFNPPIDSCGTNAEGNCAGAIEIPLEQGADNFTAEFIGTTSGCADSEAPPDGCGQRGESGPDVVYYFDLPIESRVAILVDAPFDEVIYLRRAPNADGCALARDEHCADNDPSRIAPRDPLAAGRYYLVIDAEAADAEGGRFPILIVAEPVDQPNSNDTCDEVSQYVAAWRRHAADPNNVELELPQSCLGSAQRNALCGLLDPLLAEADDGHILIGADTSAALPNYGVRPFAAGNEALCDRSPLRAADRGRDIVYFFTVDRRSEFTAELIDRGIGNGLLHLRRADAQDLCGAQVPGDAEVICRDEPARIELDSLLPGNYYLIVDGFDENHRGQFELDVTLNALPERPSNDHCHPQVANQRPAPIPLAVAGDRAAGDLRNQSLIAAANDYLPQTCGADVFGLGLGPDVVYSIAVPYDFAEATIQVTTPRGPFNLPIWNLIAYLRSGQCHDGPEVPGGCNIEGVRPPDPTIRLRFNERHFLTRGTYYLVVDGFSAQDVAETFDVSVELTRIDVQVGEGDSCAADDIPSLAFDGAPGAPDEQVVNYVGASIIGNLDRTATVGCGGAGGRDRVHRLTVAKTSLVDVTFSPDGWRGAVSLRTPGGCAIPGGGNQLACSGNQIGPLTLAPGDYWIWVDAASENDWGTYRLQVHKSPAITQPFNDTCDQVDLNQALWNDGDPDPAFPADCVEDPAQCGIIDFGEQNRLAFVHSLNEETGDDEAGTCGGGTGRDRIYRIELANPAYVTATLSHTNPHVWMYLRGDCFLQNSEEVLNPAQNVRACVEGRRGVVASIETTRQLPAGSYYLVIDGFSRDDVGTYTLQISKNPAPPADICDPGVSLAVGRGGAQSVGGLTNVASGNYQAACGGAGPDARDVVYNLPLEIPADVTINVDTGFNSAVYVTTGACDPSDPAARVLACANGAANQPVAMLFEGEDGAGGGLEPGDYFIHIDGRVAGQAGGYGLNIDVRPVTPTNNECDNGNYRADEIGPLALGERFEGGGTLIGATDEDRGPAECPNVGPDVFYTFDIEVARKDFRARLKFGSEQVCTADHPGGRACARGEVCCPEVGEVCLDPDGNGISRCEIEDARFDHYMFTRAGLCGGALHCGVESAALAIPDLDPGSYTLVVDGLAARNRGDFTLVAEAPLQPNGDCFAVTQALHPYRFVVDPDPDPADNVSPTQRMEGSLVGASKAYRMTMDECSEDNTDGTRDARFELVLAEPLDWVDITVRSREFAPIAWVQALECASGVPFGCWVSDDADGDGVFEASGRINRVVAGNHYLAVDGGAPDALGDFTVTVVAGPPLQPPTNVDCEHATEIELEVTNTIPRIGTAEVVGSTLGSTSTYVPASCEGVDANAVAAMGNTADVVYCFVIDTLGDPTTATIRANPAPGALPFLPTMYMFPDTNAYTNSGNRCSADFGAAACGAQGCCPDTHPLCKDYDYNNVTTCYRPPNCNEIDLGECGVGNPLYCGGSLSFTVGVGADDRAGGGVQPPEGAETPNIYKYYLVVDGQDAEGDFRLSVATASQVAVCDGPTDVNGACDPDAAACCAEGTVCRCQDLEIRPCADPTDLDCCSNDAENPPICVQCAIHADCTNVATPICNPATMQCEAGCADDSDCQAPTFCVIPQGAQFGTCFACNPTDPPAGGNCADNNDCPDVGGRDQFCGPDGKCSECGANAFGANDVCNDFHQCVTCGADAHCAGVENQAGVALPLCMEASGTCVECVNGDQCDDNGDCGAGEVCGLDEVCVACAAGQLCTGQGLCGDCSNNADCDPGEVCQGGNCQEQQGPPNQ